MTLITLLSECNDKVRIEAFHKQTDSDDFDPKKFAQNNQSIVNTYNQHRDGHNIYFLEWVFAQKMPGLVNYLMADHGNGYKNSDIRGFAEKLNNLQLLKIVHEFAGKIWKCHWSPTSILKKDLPKDGILMDRERLCCKTSCACETFAANGNLEGLQWAHANGYWWEGCEGCTKVDLGGHKRNTDSN